MKKLITICLFMATSFAVNAQTKKTTTTKTPLNKLTKTQPAIQEEPTAKQTLEYIKAYINNFSDDGLYSTTCNETYFIKVTGVYTDTNKPSTEVKIELKDIKAVEYNIASKSINITITGDCYESLVLFPENGKEKKSSLNISLLPNTPIENVQKIIKAIKHLAVLNGAELIKEDLFK